jgi:UDP-2,3-diacylglucosamine hydrolase
MADLKIELLPNKKVYFGSDFHLGLASASRKKEIDREKLIIGWLNSIEFDAQVIFLVGDIFDFWFEYKHAIPKGYVRFLGKIAAMADKGIDIYFFTGNHDLWMFEYLQTEIGIQIFDNPIELNISNTSIYIGHGDGLGPGDRLFKLLKKIFTNKFAKWLFKWIHPDIGIGLARRWSKTSRIVKEENDEGFRGEDEDLIQFCRAQELLQHHDYYIFGHRHLPLEIDINMTSKYFNLGEWVRGFTFGEYDGTAFQLRKYEPKP